MKIFLLPVILVLLFLVLGCNPKPSTYSFEKVDAEQAVNFITYSNHIKAILYSDTSDEYYSLPTKAWVDDKFTPFFRNFLFQYSLNTYVDGKNDCDKSQHYALTSGYILFRKENTKDGSGLAIGAFDYFSNLQQHAVVFFIVNDGGVKKMMFYEPQAQQFIELTEEQQKLCTAWRM